MVSPPLHRLSVYIYKLCVCFERRGLNHESVKYMNHETPAGTRLMERVCVCGCFNSELISFGKKKGV